MFHSKTLHHAGVFLIGSERFTKGLKGRSAIKMVHKHRKTPCMLDYSNVVVTNYSAHTNIIIAGLNIAGGWDPLGDQHVMSSVVHMNHDCL